MSKVQNEEMEIDLLEILKVLFRKWKLLILGLVAGGILAGGYTWLQPAVYQSNVQTDRLPAEARYTRLPECLQPQVPV